MRLLIAEDDERLLRSLTYIFERNHYTVDGVTSGADALAFAETGEYDGLILDVMMPEMDGMEVLRRLRQNRIVTPALFLTAKTDRSDIIEGLTAGADDYIAKPFSTDELLARTSAMLRRRAYYTPDVCEFGGMILNRSACRLELGSRSVPLSGREFQIMETLMEHPDCVLSADSLLSHVWGLDSNVEISVVWVHISNLRKKLAALQGNLKIEFIRGAGYKLTL